MAFPSQLDRITLRRPDAVDVSEDPVQFLLRTCNLALVFGQRLLFPSNLALDRLDGFVRLVPLSLGPFQVAEALAEEGVVGQPSSSVAEKPRSAFRLCIPRSNFTH